MRNSNFALRLQASLMEEAKELAKAEGVALNQLINVAVAEKLAAHRTAAFLDRFTHGASVSAALALLGGRRSAGPLEPGDELPEGWTSQQLEEAFAHSQPEKQVEPRKGSAQPRTAGRKPPRRK